jgi:competence protein ComEC
MEKFPFSQQTVFYGLLLSAAAILFLFRTRRSTALFLCLPLFFLIGHINTVIRLQAPDRPGHIASVIRQQCRVSLTGTLAAMVEYDGEKSRLVLDVREVQLLDGRGNRIPVTGRIRLSMRGRVPGFFPGDTLLIIASVRPVSNFRTPGVFDYQGYMAAKKIYLTGWIKNSAHIVRVKDLTRTGMDRLLSLPELIRQRIALFLEQHLEKRISGLYQALLIGTRSAVSRDIQEQFKTTGTMHLLAISGLHMGLLGLMLSLVFTWLFKRSEWLLLHLHVPTLALSATMPVLLGYAFIAGMNTPVLRALVMASIVLGALLLRRQHCMLHLVAAAALFVLACNPLALFTASFQLSFSAVAALALFMPRLMDTDQGHVKKTFGTSLLKGLKTALLVSIIATVGTLPFMLLHFHRFSTIGPVMNLLVEPLLCFWALPWGLVAIPFMFTFPDLAAALLQIGSFGITAGEYLTRIGAAFPYASFRTITPGTLEILCYLFLVSAWAVKGHSLYIRKLIGVAAVILLLNFTRGLWLPVKPAVSTISYLDVGQGTSSFLHLPNGARILIDAGGSRGSSLDNGERIIGPFLWKKRIWRLDAVVITHPHSDHFNGMAFVLKFFKPAVLYVNGDTRGEGNYSTILEQAKALGTKIIVPQKGQNLIQEKECRLTVLGMNGLGVRPGAPVNDRCLVLKYSAGKRGFLFPADISARSESLLLRSAVDLRADVLLAPHHGSATSNSTPFIRAVAPSFLVVSAGRSGKRLYPAPKNLAFWQDAGITTFITRDAGTITCTTDGNRLQCTPVIPRQGRVAESR